MTLTEDDGSCSMHLLIVLRIECHTMKGSQAVIVHAAHDLIGSDARKGMPIFSITTMR